MWELCGQLNVPFGPKKTNKMHLTCYIFLTWFTHFSFINQSITHSLSALLAPRHNIYNSFETVLLHFCFYEYFVSYYRLAMLAVYTKKSKKDLNCFNSVYSHNKEGRIMPFAWHKYFHTFFLSHINCESEC